MSCSLSTLLRSDVGCCDFTSGPEVSLLFRSWGVCKAASLDGYNYILTSVSIDAEKRDPSRLVGVDATVYL